MEWRDMGRRTWVDTAVRGIRFRPDRRAVRAELDAHLEDKIADLQRIFPDIPPEEAEQRAVAQMGDPEQVGSQLAKLHRPWLGYLWRASQAAAVAVALLAVWTLLCANVLWGWEDRPSFFAGSESAADYASRWCGGEIEMVELPPQEPVSYGGYTFTVTQCTVYRRVEPEPERPAHNGLVHIIIETDHRRPWESAECFGLDLWVRDDQGREIVNDPAGPAVRSWIRLERRPFRDTYELVVPLPHWESRRLELRYTSLGSDLTIPIALPEGTEG